MVWILRKDASRDVRMIRSVRIHNLLNQVSYQFKIECLVKANREKKIKNKQEGICENTCGQWVEYIHDADMLGPLLLQ